MQTAEFALGSKLSKPLSVRLAAAFLSIIYWGIGTSPATLKIYLSLNWQR